MIREDILKQFPELFGTRRVNGREVNVEDMIAMLTRELNPEIAAALTARRALLNSSEPVRKKYAWPKWDDVFPDPVTGRVLDFSPDRAGSDRQLFGPGERVALAAQ